MQNSGVNASGKSFVLKINRSIHAIYIGSTFIEFDEVRVPATNLLGQENEGFPLIMSSVFIDVFHKIQSSNSK